MRVQRTTCISGGLFAFLTGLSSARVLPFIVGGWVVVCFMVFVVQRNVWARAFGLVLFCFVAGWWRGGVARTALLPYDELSGRQVVVHATAQTDAGYGKNGQLSFDAGSVQIQQPQRIKLPGKIKVQGYGESALQRGDVVQISGSLYRTRGSRQAAISYAQLQRIHKHESLVDTLRLRFASGMQTALPEPQASFALGLIIGQRSTLPEATAASLSAVGLTHIIAVSGYNLTIIVQAVRRGGDRFSKYQITLLSLLLMGLFLLITGFSASIVRAALVSGLTLWAWYYGREFRPLVLILVAAALTAGWDPIYLWSDIGWWLSFLAFFGVIVLAPLLSRRIHKDAAVHPLLQMLYESGAAQLMTVPLILFIFGEISTVGLVSNLLVVPAVPVAMLLALVAGLAGAVVSAVSGWMALPALMLLTYMLDVADFFAAVPHAVVHGVLPLPALICAYALMIGLCTVLWQKTRQKYGILTDKKSVLTEERT